MIRETYHVRASQSGEPENTNYYRIRIKGKTLGSTSQYASGLYDSRAVDALFGELKGQTVQVDRVSLEGHHGRSMGSPSSSGSSTDPETVSTTADTRLESLDGESLENQKLVLFLSSNSDALVNEISTQAARLSTETTLAAMMLTPEIEELQLANLEANQAREEDRVLGAALRNLAVSVRQSNGTVSSIRPLLIEGLQQLARRSKRPSGADSISDVQTALDWLRRNPDAFKTAGGEQ